MFIYYLCSVRKKARKCHVHLFGMLELAVSDLSMNTHYYIYATAFSHLFFREKKQK